MYKALPNSLYWSLGFLTRISNRSPCRQGLALNAIIAILGVLVFIYGLRGSLEELSKEMGQHGGNGQQPWPWPLCVTLSGEEKPWVM